MKKVLFLMLVGLMGMGARAEIIGSPYQPEVDARFNRLEGGDSAFQARAGTKPAMQAVGVWDYALHGGSSAAAISLGVTLPKNSLITRSYFFIPTVVTATNNGQNATDKEVTANRTQASFGCLTATDLLAATDIPLRYNPTNREMAINGVQMATTAGDSATFLNVDAGCTPTMTLTNGNFTAGKIIMYLDYIVH